MQETPPPERIIAAVRERYDLRITNLVLLPLGQELLARRYRAETADGAVYFLKLHKGAVSRVALLAPRYLAALGIQQAVAPVRTRMLALSVAIDGQTLALYPFIDGETGAGRPLQERHWRAYGAAISAVHAAALPPDLLQFLSSETFVSPWAERVWSLDAFVADRASADAIAAETAAFWLSRRAQIRALADRLMTLGARLRAEPPPLVLCHADVHLNNVLIDRQDRLWIVDWDDARLAAKECDLFFGLGGVAGARANSPEAGWFLEGYGGPDVDPVVLAYYRCLRAVEDIGAYAEQVLLTPALGAARRTAALQRLMSVFAPGNIVSVIGG